PGLVFHAIYNSLSLCLGSNAAAESSWARDWPWLLSYEGAIPYRWPALVVSVILSSVLLAALRRMGDASSPEPEASTPRHEGAQVPVLAADKHSWKASL
ncbi:MAG: hypothetical protein AB7O38_28240, partial [Pirellulaceae bacterium]